MVITNGIMDSLSKGNGFVKEGIPYSAQILSFIFLLYLWQHRIQWPGGGRGPRNMKSMWLPLAAIFFMTYLHRAGGGHDPLGTPPGSATVCAPDLFIEFLRI